MVRARTLVVATAVALVLAGGAGTPLAQGQLVIHKEGTLQYHRPWCAVVRDGKGVLALTLGQAAARGLKSHPECEKPPDDAATPTGSTGFGARPAPPPAPVFTDSTKYYHRAACSRAAGPLTRASLDEVGKTRWPCPVCRPPLRKKADGPAVPKRGTRR
jgi:hypothetical protein